MLSDNAVRSSTVNEVRQFYLYMKRLPETGHHLRIYFVLLICVDLYKSASALHGGYVQLFQ